jgi:hypothetical protein
MLKMLYYAKNNDHCLYAPLKKWKEPGYGQSAIKIVRKSRQQVLLSPLCCVLGTDCLFVEPVYSLKIAALASMIPN